jgi:hypothetical protein
VTLYRRNVQSFQYYNRLIPPTAHYLVQLYINIIVQQQQQQQLEDIVSPEIKKGSFRINRQKRKLQDDDEFFRAEKTWLHRMTSSREKAAPDSVSTGDKNQGILY